MFPVISEAVRGVKITVGPPFFNRVNAPLGLVLLFLTGVGPVIAWRRASARNLQKNFLIPVALGLGRPASRCSSPACATTTPWSRSRCAPSCWRPSSWSSIAACARARRWWARTSRRALAHLIGKNRRRYGGYIIHVGMVMMFLAITGTSAFKQEQQITVKPGDSVPDRRLHAALRRRRAARDAAHRLPDRRASRCSKDGKQIDTLQPEKRFYKKPEQPTTEVAIRSTLGADLYLVLGSYDDASQHGDDPGVRQSAGRLPVVGRDRAGARHRRHHLAGARAGARAGVRAGRRRRGRERTERDAPERDASAGVAAGAACWRCAGCRSRRLGLGATPVSFQEIEESLTCQCGCGLTVHSCNHLQCPSAIPLREEIRAQMDDGQGQGGDPRLLLRQVRREDPLVADDGGFNLVAWIAPFVVLGRRRRLPRRHAEALERAQSHRQSAERRRPRRPASPYSKILEKELKNFDA